MLIIYLEGLSVHGMKSTFYIYYTFYIFLEKTSDPQNNFLARLCKSNIVIIYILGFIYINYFQ